SAWGRPPPQPTSTACSSCCRRWWRRRAGKRPPSFMSGRQRVVVAMSGGVDSAVAAARALAAGHDVVGISLRLAADGGGSCCSLDDFHDARSVAHTLFPVGDLTKAEVRAEAAALGLAVADKPESMEVCFVPGGDVAEFVERHAPAETLRPGLIVDETGRELGRHAGVHRFTVGQRPGLGLASGSGTPRYVRALDAGTATVTVSDAAGLRARGLVAREVSWTSGAAPAPDTPLAVRIRHRHPLIPARLLATDAGVTPGLFDDDGPGVPPGQAAV